MKSFSLAVLSFASLGLSAAVSQDTRQLDLPATIESYVFNISMTEFIKNRNAKNPAELDWSSDGCTSSLDNPFGFNFQDSCYRHDFAYRNFKKQGQFTKTNKARIDSNFEKDMRNSCAGEKLKKQCEFSAKVYYEVVKAVPKKHRLA